jgi:hypothetical protein
MGRAKEVHSFAAGKFKQMQSNDISPVRYSKSSGKIDAVVALGDYI